jgi:hypothetical protein
MMLFAISFDATNSHITNIHILYHTMLPRHTMTTQMQSEMVCNKAKGDDFFK